MLQIISEITKVETVHDGGLKLVVHTNEASPDDMALLMGLRGKQGMMLFKENIENFTEAEVKDLPEVKVEQGQKTPSERLRAIIYRIWEHNTNQKQAFQLYYIGYMDKLCEGLKEKIQP